MEDKLLICSCNRAEHQIIVREIEGEYYANIHLVHFPFFKRLILGIKYIFGYKCKYGNFEEFILDDRHILPLRDIMFRLMNKYK